MILNNGEGDFIPIKLQSFAFTTLNSARVDVCKNKLVIFRLFLFVCLCCVVCSCRHVLGIYQPFSFSLVSVDTKLLILHSYIIGRSVLTRR